MACNMGGMGFIENNKAECMLSVLVNTHMLMACKEHKVKKYFFSSSACAYNKDLQDKPDISGLKESDAYPANPDSEYGWEKLFSERLYFAFSRNYNMDVRVARFHNIFGPEGTWNGGREKAPAAMCRKVAECEDGGCIEMWGDGKQTRSFLYIDECLEAMRRLMDSDFIGPVNIGSEEMVTINKLAEMVMDIANKKISIKHIDGPLGVRGRNSDNRLIQEKLGWRPTRPLKEGLKETYKWISQNINNLKV